MKKAEKPHKTKKADKPFNRDHAYEVVTERFIKYIEEHGQLPWRKPWMVVQPDIAPMNYKSKTPYSGVNIFMCLMSGFESPYWLTYKQAVEMGGQVRKGEKATPIIRFNPPDKKRLQAIDDDDSLDDEEKAERKKRLFGFYKVFLVFNAEQIDGIEFPKAEPTEPAKVFNPIEEAEKVVANMPNRPTIVHREPGAFYRPFDDSINMPKRELFDSPEDYYSTLFHELSHSTGHKSRLGRLEDQRDAAFGSADYSKEELVAELSSSFVMNELGIENSDTERNSAAYLANWCKAMKSNVKMLVQAMNKAIPSANYIFGRHDSLKGETT